jgi:hypothetical protein
MHEFRLDYQTTNMAVLRKVPKRFQECAVSLGALPLAALGAVSISNPRTTASALQLTAATMLAPASASARLLALARPLDLAGVASIRLPYIGISGRPVVPFVL